jgi:beta-mannanase
MKKLLLLLLFFLGLAFSIYAVYKVSNSSLISLEKTFFMETKMVERFNEPVLGIYDPQNHLTYRKPDDFKHFVLILLNDEKWEIDENLLQNVQDNVPILLTVEMWDKNVLQKITQGDYDINIRGFFGPLLKDHKSIFLRWNPEMDVPSSRYPWEMNPTLYISAFNRFAGIIKKVAPHTNIVWGPAGQPGALEHYPGDKLVNVSSITLNGNSEKMLKNYLQDSLPYQIQRKFHRLRFIDKPVLVLGSENFGVSEFKNEWICKAEDLVLEYEETIYSEENFLRPDFQPEVKEEILLGFYDPGVKFLTNKEVSIEHIFMSFSDIQNGYFKKIFNEANSRDNDLIITVEPGMENHKISDPDVLKNVITGKYDNILEELYSILASTEKEIYLRFAHEMEIPITRYAWQSKDPVQYIKAFRHFMEYPEEDFKHIKKVWGPAGDRGSLEWYPGNDVVDYVSIAIYGLPDKNITDPEQQETFSRILSRKMYRFRFLNKPVFITEFGVMGDEKFQSNWLLEAAKAIRNEPQIVGVNYFNEIDVPKAWGDIQPPNWSISRNTYRQFVETLYSKKAKEKS